MRAGLERSRTATEASHRPPAVEDPKASFVLRVRAARERERADEVTGEVVASFKEAGLSPVLLKGPALTSWLYGSSSARAYVDTDLLVAPAELHAARLCLMRLGFEERLSEKDTPGWTRRGSAWLREGQPAMVDLHVTLPGIGVEPTRLWRALQEDLEAISVRGVRVAVPSERARALHLALHAMQHGTAVAQPLRDLALGLQRLDRPTWQRAARLAEKLEATAGLAAGLRLLPEGRVLADELRLPSELPVEVALLAGEAPAGALALEAFSRAGGPRRAAALAARKLVPSRRFMRAWFGPAAAGRPGGMLVGYLYRPLWLALRAVPAWRAWRRARATARR